MFSWNFLFSILTVFIVHSIHAHTNNYICGAKFRSLADHSIEQTRIHFRPEDVQSGSIIYIAADYLGYFFSEVFPRIHNPIILISHNSDSPSPGAYGHYLDDPKIIVWFGQNSDINDHPKFVPIPIGLANPQWSHGNPQIFDEALEYVHSKLPLQQERLYINFAEGTNIIRPWLINYFKDKHFVTIPKKSTPGNYLKEMAGYRFILSPWGNGLDCHRTWEALYMGCIPVVKKSTLDKLYTHLPVIIVQEWEEITLDLLTKRHKELNQQPYHREKLFMDYWIKLIESYQNKKNFNKKLA